MSQVNTLVWETIAIKSPSAGTVWLGMHQWRYHQMLFMCCHCVCETTMVKFIKLWV